MKKGGLILMVLGLLFMFVASTHTSNMNYIGGGLIIVSMGALLSRLGEK